MSWNKCYARKFLVPPPYSAFALLCKWNIASWIYIYYTFYYVSSTPLYSVNRIPRWACGWNVVLYLVTSLISLLPRKCSKFWIRKVRSVLVVDIFRLEMECLSWYAFVVYHQTNNDHSTTHKSAACDVQCGCRREHLTHHSYSSQLNYNYIQYRILVFAKFHNEFSSKIILSWKILHLHSASVRPLKFA